MKRKEVWAPLHWVDARYDVSSAGRVRSWIKVGAGGGALSRPRLLALQTVTGGYLQVYLYNKGRLQGFKVHRLVLRAFAGAPRPGAEGNHKNGNKRDNALRNLEWCTRSDNLKHSFRVLKTPHARSGKLGTLSPSSKGVVQLTSAGAVVKRWASLSDAGRAGFNPAHISAVCQGAVRKTHAGFKWKYATKGAV